MRHWIIGAAAVAIIAGCAQTELTGESEDRLEADVRFLASDLLEGRETGKRGYDIAARYVAEQFRAAGVEPISEELGYYQQVPFAEVSQTLEGGGEVSISDMELIPGEDYVAGGRDGGGSFFEAPMVFAGYGIVSEAHGINDYDGLDVEGAVVVLLSGSAKGFNSEEGAYLRGQQLRVAAEQGAIGSISIVTPEFEATRAPFAVLKTFVNRPRLSVDAPEDGARLTGGAFLNPERAPELFEGAPVTWDEIVDASTNEKGRMRTFALDRTVSMRFETEKTTLSSPNVIGVVRGTDPELADEIVVATAHLDHIGMGDAVEGEEDKDLINNGAMDNATGTASLLEAARWIALNPQPRTVVFAALTAEEKGLLGSEYLAANPAIEGTVVANVNLDMPVLTYEFVDVIAFGADRSTLGPIVAEAAEAKGVELIPDPMPEQGIFTRSDHYSFVREGVPSVFLMTGFGNGGSEKFPAFLGSTYHSPADEIDNVMFDQLARFSELNTEIIRAVASAEERPKWNHNDFFGLAFGGEMAPPAPEPEEGEGGELAGN